MEKYHIYEEIGKGKFSQIFKGREKKNIEYVAIKRVDKATMDKVVNEVQIIHRLESPHTIKFHDWYETRNNLWLILEYCVGGDLDSLIKQDGHLPETSVRMFSLDILAGLKYLHSTGFLHCDLRPKNILIDEYGILKISDFKYTRKIPKAPLQSQPLSSRGGSPRYMSPELFSVEGVHSYASDFWSLGCVIYELRCGCHPFVDDVSTSTTTVTSSAVGYNQDYKAGGDARHTASEHEAGDVGEVDIAVLLEIIRSRDPLSSSPSSTSTSRTPRHHSPLSSLSPELLDLLAWLLEKVPSFRCDWKQLCSHPFWQVSRPSPPKDLPQQVVYDNFVRNHLEGTLESFVEDDVSESSSTRRRDIRSQVEMKVEKQFIFQNENIFDDKLGDVQVAEERRSSSVRTPDKDSRSTNNCHIENSSRPAAFVANILTHFSDSQVKPIVNNRAIETIEKYASPGRQITSVHFQTLSPEQLSALSQAKIENHMSQVYKSLQANLASTPSGSSRGASAIPNTSFAQQSSHTNAASTEKLNILSYLCSISSNTDVANTVLNTVFVNLLLHILKTPSNPKVVLNHSHKPTTSLSAKALAATSLALFLRYATYVEPPKVSKEKEEDVTLIAVLINVLRDLTLPRQDAVLRHRALAALGEIVFYISVQEEDDDESDAGARRWVLPSAAVGVLVKALGDENDEIARHYAAKTIENVLAQGGYLSRRKFCSFDLALRLFELSQHSRNASIQATCAMALFHLFLTVVEEDKRGISDIAHLGKTRGKLKSTTDEIPAPAKGTQFIGRVLEKTGLVGFIDTLKDGRPRLQQAYLNIFNLIFFPLAKDKEVKKSIDDPSLTGVRSFFMKAHARLLPSLCRLCEQGSSAIVRAKALLGIGLCCRHRPDLMISLCDQRFHSMLMKLVEPVIVEAEKFSDEKSSREGGRLVQDAFGRVQEAFGSHRSSSSSSTYTGQCLLFLLHVIRTQLSDSVSSIVDDLVLQNSMKSQCNTYETPTKKFLSNESSNGSGAKRFQQDPGDSPLLGVRSPSIASPHGGEVEKVSLISFNVEILKAAISLSSHPSIRRLTVSMQFISAVTALLTLTPFLNNPNSDIKFVIEEALSISLEFLCQTDLLHCVEVDAIRVVITSLIPAAVKFCGICVGDTRVVVVTFLRRLLPTFVPTYFNEEKYRLLFINDILRQLPLTSLLADQAPIPQYTVRLLTEVVDSMPKEHSGEKEIVNLFCSEDPAALANHRVLQTLLFSALMGNESAKDYSNDNSRHAHQNEGDAHVAKLLTHIFRMHNTSIVIQQLQLFRGGLSNTMLSVFNIACSQKKLELLGSMCLLMSESLSFLKYALTIVALSKDFESQSEIVNIAVHLSSNIPRILSILVWTQPPQEAPDEECLVSSLFSMQQCCLHMFSLFMDVIPLHLINVLCTDEALESREESTMDYSFGRIFSLVVSSNSLDLRLLLKLLGLFLRFTKTSMNLPTCEKVLRFISTNPVHASLLECRSRDNSHLLASVTSSDATYSDKKEQEKKIVEAIDMIKSLVTQILSFVNY